MFRVCAYYISSASKDDFEHWLEALDRAAQICNDGKALSVEIQNLESGKTLREFYPDIR